MANPGCELFERKCLKTMVFWRSIKHSFHTCYLIWNIIAGDAQHDSGGHSDMGVVMVVAVRIPQW